MVAILSRNNSTAQVSSTHGAAVAVTVPTNTIGAWISNASALTTVTLEMNPVQATQTLTFTGVGLAGETITIGAHVYTLRAAVASTADEVLIGATATATASALAAAINKDLNLTSLYGTSTVKNTQVTAFALGAVVVITAILGGAAANSIATTETSTLASWGAATMAGGVDSSGKGIVLPPGISLLFEWGREERPDLQLFNSHGATDANINFSWMTASR